MFTRGRNVDRAIYRQTVSRFHLICITHCLYFEEASFEEEEKLLWLVCLLGATIAWWVCSIWSILTVFPPKWHLHNVHVTWVCSYYTCCCLCLTTFVCLFCNCCSCNVLQLLTSRIPADILTCLNSPKRSKVWERTENVKFGKSVKADRPPSRLPTNSL